MGTSKKKGLPKGSSAPPKPKKECCVSKSRCTRCPIRLMKAGELPPGYTVKKRKLVKVKVKDKATRPDKPLKHAGAA